MPMQPPTEIVTVRPADLATRADAQRERVEETLADGGSPNTARAYRADIEHFQAWCALNGCVAVPASEDTLSRYFTQLSDGAPPHPPKRSRVRSAAGNWSMATIRRRRAAIGTMHELAKLPNPCRTKTLDMLMRAIARRIGAPARGVAPMLPDRLVQAVALLRKDATPRGRRDVALLLLGFAGAFRRSELAGLRLEDVRFIAGGATVFLRASKGDREGHGAAVTVLAGSAPDTDPVATLRAWMDEAPASTGPLFRGVDRAGNLRDTPMPAAEVARLVKRVARMLGLDPQEFAGHSLRAGFVTAAFESGASIDAVKDHSRHARYDTVLGYNRQVNKIKNHPGRGLL